MSECDFAASQNPAGTRTRLAGLGRSIGTAAMVSVPTRTVARCGLHTCDPVGLRAYKRQSGSMKQEARARSRSRSPLREWHPSALEVNVITRGARYLDPAPPTRAHDETFDAHPFKDWEKIFVGSLQRTAVKRFAGQVVEKNRCDCIMISSAGFRDHRSCSVVS